MSETPHVKPEAAGDESLPPLTPPPRPITDVAEPRVPPDQSAATGSRSEGLVRLNQSEVDVIRDNGLRAFLWQIHEYTNGYIKFSDQKAAVVIAFAGALIAAMYSQSLHVPIVTIAPARWSAPAWLSLVSFAFVVGALLAAGWSVRPRLKSYQSVGYIFWENVRAHGSEQAFWDALRQESESVLTRELAVHLHTLAGVCSKKYMWVSLSIGLIIVGGLTTAIAMVFG